MKHIGARSFVLLLVLIFLLKISGSLHVRAQEANEPDVDTPSLYMPFVQTESNGQDGLGFGFTIDPEQESVEFDSTYAASTSDQAIIGIASQVARKLKAGAEIRLNDLSVSFQPGRKLIIRASFTNITEDKQFRQPFFFTVNRLTTNIEGSVEPTVSDADLGGDGILSPGETTSILTFEVTHRNRLFLYLVDVHAVVEDVVNENAVTIFSASFVKTKGTPEGQTATFTLPEIIHGPFTLIVRNGDTGGANRVSAAIIKLNGITVVKQSDFNQNVVGIERKVSILAENTLEVELRGKSNSSLTIAIMGEIEPDTTIDDTSVEVDANGGTIELPGIAELSIPPGAVESGVIRLFSVESVSFDLFQEELYPAFSPLALPKIRIVSSTPLNQPLSLAMALPEEVRLSPTAADLRFAAHVWSYGPDDGPIDEVIPIGGYLCGLDDLACVTILPEWFMVSDPVDTMRREIIVSLGTIDYGDITAASQVVSAVSAPQQLWSVSNAKPATPLTVSKSDTTRFSLDLVFNTSFTFLPGTPVAQIDYSGKFFRNKSPAWHGGVDLRTPDNTTVFSALPSGWAALGPAQKPPKDKPFTYNNGRTETDPILCKDANGNDVVTWGGFGRAIYMQHPEKTEVVYGHLERYNIRQGAAPSPNVPIAYSDNSGKSCNSHLHFEVRYQGQAIDPEPILAHDLSMYLRNTETEDHTIVVDPLTMELRLYKATSGTVINVPQPQEVTSLSQPFIEDFSFAGVPDGSYKMKLVMNSARLGERVLHSWDITVKAGLELRVMNLIGTGDGTVVSDPPGIDLCRGCADDSAEFAGGVVLLTATPDNDSVFDHWEGDCNGTTAVITVVMDKDKLCHVVFRSIPEASGVLQVPANSSSYRYDIYTVPPDVNGAWVSFIVRWDSDWYFPADLVHCLECIIPSSPYLVEVPYYGGVDCDFIRLYPWPFPGHEDLYNNYASGSIDVLDRFSTNEGWVNGIEVGPGATVAIAGSTCVNGGDEFEYTAHMIVVWEVDLVP